MHAPQRLAPELAVQHVVGLAGLNWGGRVRCDPFQAMPLSHRHRIIVTIVVLHYKMQRCRREPSAPLQPPPMLPLDLPATQHRPKVQGSSSAAGNGSGIVNEQQETLVAATAACNRCNHRHRWSGQPSVLHPPSPMPQSSLSHPRAIDPWWAQFQQRVRAKTLRVSAAAIVTRHHRRYCAPAGC